MWVSASGTAHSIDIDLGAAQTIDSLYIGGCDAAAASTLALAAATGMGSGLVTLGTQALRLSGAPGPTYQSLLCVDAVTTRYLRVTITCPAAQILRLGTLIVGRGWSHAYAYGAGRPLIDLSRRTELVDGGFGVDAGAVKSGFRWRFIDLDDAAAEALYAILRSRGTSRPVVIAEDADALPPRDTALHYGLFDRFETWERANAIDTQWALSLTEWR